MTENRCERSTEHTAGFFGDDKAVHTHVCVTLTPATHNRPSSKRGGGGSW